MAIASSPVVEISGSPWKMLGLSVLGVIMTGLSAAIALRLFPGMQVDGFHELMGYVGTVFFGLCTVIGFWRLLTMRGPVVTIARRHPGYAGRKAVHPLERRQSHLDMGAQRSESDGACRRPRG